MKFKHFFATSMLAAAVVMPQMATADSQLNFGGMGTTAEANLDFRITIPNFLFFQIGSAGATVDRVDFDLGVPPPGTQPGSGGLFSATGGTGDGTDGALTVNLITNAANVSIAATGGNLTSGADSLPFADITATDTGAITVPDFGATVGPVAIGTLSLSDTWTYTYDNTTVYPAGTYDGTVTYTVTVL
ncbi:MAG: hypothetical protein JKY90_01075 [Gammaproteobacteria bacterium]|nr:hypothetical protein [Gammaproteobacteria bacterium]